MLDCVPLPISTMRPDARHRLSCRRSVVRSGSFHVALQFLVEFTFDALLLHEGFQADLSLVIHSRCPSWESLLEPGVHASRMREMARIWRCHCSVSAMRALRPLAVSR